MQLLLPRSPRLRPIFSAASLVAFAATAWSQNLVVNGGFELTPASTSISSSTPTQIFSSGWYAATDAGGSTTLTIFSAPGFNEPNPADGSRLLNIGGFGSSKGIVLLWQDFSTVIGQDYAVSFYFGRSNNSDGTETVSVDALAYDVVGGVANGGALAQVSSGNAPATGATSDLTEVTFSFTATGTTSRLLFDDTTVSSGASLHLDAISVTAVPEPAAMGLLLGLGSLALGLRRRR